MKEKKDRVDALHAISLLLKEVAGGGVFIKS
jgi:hypothetical protein